MKPCNLLLVFVLSFLINLPSLLAQQSATHAAVPRLIRFSGVITDLGGGSRTGVAGVTFSFYKEPAVMGKMKELRLRQSSMKVTASSMK